MLSKASFADCLSPESRDCFALRNDAHGSDGVAVGKTVAHRENGKSPKSVSLISGLFRTDLAFIQLNKMTSLGKVKNIRRQRGIQTAFTLIIGFPAGAKAQVILGTSSARLKPCPDTKPVQFVAGLSSSASC
jgi:hypothetical protein